MSEQTSEPNRRIPSRRELRARRHTTDSGNHTPEGEGFVQPVVPQAQPTPASRQRRPQHLDMTGEQATVTPPAAVQGATPQGEVNAGHVPQVSHGVLHSRHDHGGTAGSTAGVPFGSDNHDNAPDVATRRRSHWFMTLLILVLIGVVIWGGIYIAQNFLIAHSDSDTTDDYEGSGTTTVTVEIPQGASGTVIAGILVDNDVIASKQAFLSALSFNPESTSIQPGVYSLKHQMNATIALNALLDNTNRIDVGITVPEGFQISQLKDRLVKLGGYSMDDLTAALSNPEKIGLPPEANGNPEGWIAPGTYTQKPGEPATDLIARMVKHNTDRLEKLSIPRDQWLTVLTKASILEREMSIKKYLPQTARVIENRLDEEKGKPVLHKLQMDSTVSYGVGRVSGLPTKDELQKDTPYNTYVHEGLPPGPIATAGDNAIDAVLHPAEGDWLYFVTTNLETGETTFATTYEEFLEAKAQLKQYCEEKPDRC